MEVENFSGKTTIAVKQDFYAKMFLLTLCSVYAFPIEEKVREEYSANDKRKHDQKINRTGAIAMTRDILVAVFIKRDCGAALFAFNEIVFKTREIIRPERSNERNHRPKRSYSMNYKRL